MLHYLFAIFHWNACLSYFLSHYLSTDLMSSKKNAMPYAATSTSSYVSNKQSNFLHNEFSINMNKSDPSQLKYKYGKPKLDIYGASESELIKDYLKAFYLSTKLMTLIIEIPNPKTNMDYLFSIFQLIIALLLFSSIIGHVGYIVSNLGNARKEFQCKYL